MNWKLVLKVLGLLGAVGAACACVGCSPTEAKEGIEPFFDALATGATAAGLPWAAPLLHSAGSLVSHAFGSDGALIASGIAAKHHYDFGLTPKRRQKLAGARNAHRAAKAQAP